MNPPEAQEPIHKPASGLNDALMGSITKTIVIAYIGFVLVFWASTVWSNCCDAESGTNWLELTKVGFTTLGSAFTLILGYYFGHRLGAQEGEKKAHEKDVEIARTTGEITEKKQRIEDLVARMADRVTPDAPEELKNSSQRQKGSPTKP